MPQWNGSGTLPKHLWQHTQVHVCCKGHCECVAEQTHENDKSTETDLSLTKYGHHHIVPEDLNGAPGNEIEGSENVPAVDQSVTRRGVGGLEVHGESSQAAFAGASKRFAVLQQATVQMEANVSLQTLGETL